MNENRLREQLVIDEGMRLDVYPDDRGYPTVGIGHLITPGDKLELGNVITEDRCTALFEADLARTLTGVRRLVPDLDALPDAAQEALANMAFNLGCAGLAGFPRFLAAMRGRSWAHAVDELRPSIWHIQVKSRALRIEASILSLVGAA